jgi:DNA-directed RNA polymerase subunit RPC12/RpoP
MRPPRGRVVATFSLAAVASAPAPYEHVECERCGAALDFGESDGLGRVLEACRSCGTRRLMPRIAPPRPAPGSRRGAWLETR